MGLRYSSCGATRRGSSKSCTVVQLSGVRRIIDRDARSLGPAGEWVPVSPHRLLPLLRSEASLRSDCGGHLRSGLPPLPPAGTPAVARLRSPAARSPWPVSKSVSERIRPHRSEEDRRYLACCRKRGARDPRPDSGCGPIPFDALVERFAQMFAERVSAALPKASRNGTARRAGGSKRDMGCRYPACKNRSKGPRFRFLCEEHLKLPKRKQDEVLAKVGGEDG